MLQSFMPRVGRVVPMARAVAAAKGYGGISPREAIPAADRERDRGPAPAQVRPRRESHLAKPQICPPRPRIRRGTAVTGLSGTSKPTLDLVELRGFELLTPSMRTQCATGQTGQVTASAQVSGLRTATVTASEAA